MRKKASKIIAVVIILAVAVGTTSFACNAICGPKGEPPAETKGGGDTE